MQNHNQILIIVFNKILFDLYLIVYFDYTLKDVD